MSDTTTHSQDPHATASDAERALKALRKQLRILRKLGVIDNSRPAGDTFLVSDLLGTVARNPLDVPASLTREDVRAIVSEELETQLSASPSADHRGIALVSADQRNWNMRRYVESYHARWGNYPDDARLAATFPSASHEERDKVLFEFVDAGAHSVGDGPGAGDASATPATEVTLDYLVAAVRDANLDIKSLRRIDEAARANYNESGRNLAKAIKDRSDSERALLDHLTGDQA
ncbi:hypothetical protein [Rhodococcus sp. NPDC060176]|uniref:hypothetical protein n=1 Tax=Rhodococcus sp. NPDC060176 TaxID=3347062 RepID=UPI003647EE3B